MTKMPSNEYLGMNPVLGSLSMWMCVGAPQIVDGSPVNRRMIITTLSSKQATRRTETTKIMSSLVRRLPAT